ncbi:hypothetical protein GCM10009665_32820 [Kitasatospora nipponensis]|uniref:Methyltransferase type 11 domain-containing protein n=1 Tax=Kitasatospora nipponensis TaxID=258049 RepID=A0ABN1W827_9ACTN
MASAHGTVQAPDTEPGLVTPRAGARARDWAEIQERMLVPLYEAVHERLEVGPATSLLGLGCRSGLALLLAAARGAQVAGVEPREELRELARARGLRVGAVGAGPLPAPPTAHALVTVFDPSRLCADPRRTVREAARLTLPGGQVVLAGWGPPERCESAAVLEVARRRSGPRPAPDPFALSRPGALEELLATAGLRPAGSGRVSCPFAYPDLESAVRGLLSTGCYDAAIGYSGEVPVTKEVIEALHPFTHSDGTVRMTNVFRYLLADRPRRPGPR